MIEPNMATMLAYIFTDAELEAPTLDRMLRQAVHVSFNMLSVDTDTSTSDTCAILANGLAGRVDEGAFLETLTAGCIRMTEMLARDGEGAKHLLRATVRGAASDDDARRVAKSLVNSPLIKTMVHGADPNVGRLLMAVGKAFDVDVQAGEHRRVDQRPRGGEGRRAARLRRGGRARGARGTRSSTSRWRSALGDASATAYGCDLTNGYIEENAAYYSS